MRDDKDHVYRWNYAGQHITVEFIYLQPYLHRDIGLPDDNLISAYEVSFYINDSVEKTKGGKLSRSQIATNLDILNEVFSKIHDVFVNTKSIDVICFTPHKDCNDLKGSATVARDILKRMHEFIKQNNIPDNLIGNDYTQIYFYVKALRNYVFSYSGTKEMSWLEGIEDEIYSLEKNSESKRGKIFELAIKQYIGNGYTVNKLENGDIVIIKPNVINN